MRAGSTAATPRSSRQSRTTTATTASRPRLRDWLLEQRAKAVAKHGEIEWFVRPERERPEDAREIDAEQAALVATLTVGLPDDPLDDSADEGARRLMSHLLAYHQREARPVWWAFFHRVDSDQAELIDDLECIGGLEPDPGTPAQAVGKGSSIQRMRVPLQETKQGEGKVRDPARPDMPALKIEAIDVPRGWLDLRRGPKYENEGPTTALIPGGPYDTREHRAALRRLAGIVGVGPDATGPFRACRDLLLGLRPRVSGHAAETPLYTDSTNIEELRGLISALDQTALIVQGPPGSGKTYTGARLITHLIAAGQRVGVAAPSHESIHNLLDGVEAAAAEESLEFRRLKKMSNDNPDSGYESRHITPTTNNAALTDDEVDLAAGTSWHFTREENDETLDYLVIDEAGQVSLADALAMGTAARNIVLLGDPQQLPQVSQGRHPDGAERSRARARARRPPDDPKHMRGLPRQDLATPSQAERVLLGADV